MFSDKIQQLDDHPDYDVDVIALTETWYTNNYANFTPDIILTW